jgi:hypothetical protein
MSMKIMLKDQQDLIEKQGPITATSVDEPEEQ